MIFEKLSESRYACFHWDYGMAEDAQCGELITGREGYFVFRPEEDVDLTCGDMKELTKELSRLNQRLLD